MKRSNFIIISTILGSLLTTSLVIFQTKAFAAQELESTNLGCTQKLRKVLGQQPPDYCSSAEADSGILFDKDQSKITRNSDKTIQLEFRAFNRGPADALVEVYDSGGRLRDIKIIDGNRPPTGLIQSGGDLLTKPLRSRYPLGDDRRDLKEQNIIVTIPAGGSVKITKSSNFAVWYNSAMLAVEIAQLRGGDPEFTKSETTKQLVREFAKEFGQQTAINIFKGEPSLQSALSLDFFDKDRLGEVLQKLVQYTATIEGDPSKNPILGAFSDIYLTGANYGLETAIDTYILPGLGTFARNVRIGGNTVITFARATDLRKATIYGKKGTVTFRDTMKVAAVTTAPIFRPIIEKIQNQIPKGIVMRLPSSFPVPPISFPKYRPEIVSKDDYFAVMFANCPPPSLAICDTGRIFVARKGSNADEWLQETKQKGKRIQLTSEVIGFYYSYIQPTRGRMQRIMWEQDGMIYGVISRSMSQKEAISVAISMANTTPTRSLKR